MVWAHARTQKLCLFGRGYRSYVEGHSKLRRPDIFPLAATERRLREAQLATYYSGDSPPHQQGVLLLGRPLRRRLSERSSCKSGLSLSSVSRAPPLGMSVSRLASGAITAATTANHRRLSPQNPYNTRV